MLNVMLIRHAPSINKQGCVPSPDCDADITNKAAFKALAAHLPVEASWWVSTIKRCRMTASALTAAGATPADIVYDNRLIEQDYGAWHDTSIAAIWDEIKDKPKSNWHFLHPSIKPPQGESFIELHARLQPVIDEIEALGEGNLVIIAHAMVNRSLIAHALRLPVEQALALAFAPLAMTRMAMLKDNTSQDDGNGGNSGGPGQGGPGQGGPGHGGSSQGGPWMLESHNQTFICD